MSERDPRVERDLDFWRAVRAPGYDVKLGGPIRISTWDEPMEYFASDHRAEDAATGRKE